LAVSMSGLLRRAGRDALRLLEMLVLAFWLGGGLMAIWIVPVSLRSYFQADQADQAEKVVRGVQSWFSNAEIIAGVLILILLFLFERSRKKSLYAWGTLVVLAIVNEYIVASWLKNTQATDPKHYHLRLTYLGLFAAAMAIALVLFMVGLLFRDREEAQAAARGPAAVSPPPARAAEPGAALPPRPPPPRPSPPPPPTAAPPAPGGTAGPPRP
jgi:hypothetical protein